MKKKCDHEFFVKEFYEGGQYVVAVAVLECIHCEEETWDNLYLKEQG